MTANLKVIHTPGPWSIWGLDDLPDGISDLVIVASGFNEDENEFVVCNIGPPIAPVHPGPEACQKDLANARLIAASPKLLRELIAVKRWLAADHCDMGKINAAIAEATGDEQ